MGSSQHASRCRDGAWRVTRRSAASGPKVGRNPPHLQGYAPVAGLGRPVVSARNDSLVWIEALVTVSGAGGGYSVTPAEGGRLVSSTSANTKWCLGPEGACGSAMRCVPETVDG